jgi:hypothetical protein
VSDLRFKARNQEQEIQVLTSVRVYDGPAQNNLVQGSRTCPDKQSLSAELDQ